MLALRRNLGRQRRVEPKTLCKIRAEIAAQAVSLEPTAPGTAQVSVLCRTLEQVEVAVAHPSVRTIYTDFENLRWHVSAGEIIRKHGKRFIPATLRVMKPREHAFLRAILAASPNAVLVRNLAVWHLLTQWEPSLEVIGDYSLNVANEITAWLLKRAGFAYLTPSYDLNGEQLLDLLARVPAAWFEVTIQQHMPMFHMEHCVFCAVLSPGTNKTNCGRPCDDHVVRLRDRVGAEHLLTADVGVDATRHLLDTLQKRVRRDALTEASQLQDALKDALVELLTPLQAPLDVTRHKPFILMLAGVNGAGKTTTIGKLAKLYQSQGLSVLLAAGDTFRAAAIEQLRIWGERIGAPVISGKEGGDAAGIDLRFVTAGPSHWSANDVDVPTAGDWVLTLDVQLTDTDSITADFSNAVLKLTLPKAPKAKPRKIEVRTGKRD